MIELVPPEYQERMITDVIADPLHALFVDPGLGKTAAVLEAFRRMRFGCDVARMLVIAPIRVCECVWPDEVLKWRQFQGLRAVNLHDTGPAGLAEPADIYLINPHGLRWLLGERVNLNPDPDGDADYKWSPGEWNNWRGRPDMLAVDESTFFKRSTSDRTKTMRKYANHFGRRVIMTGTPSPNGVEDLFGQMLVLDGGASLGVSKVTQFRTRWMDAVPRGRYGVKYVPKEGAVDSIVRKIAPRVTVLRADDWVTLPEQIPVDVPVKLPDRVLRMYEGLARDAAVSLTAEDARVLMDDDSDTMLVGNSPSKLRQLANGCVYTNAPFEARRWQKIHDAKIDALEQLLDELGRPALIGYEFRHEAEAISHRLKLPVVGGMTTPKQSRALFQQWNAGQLPGLLLHPMAGGHGLNLQFGGDTIVWFSTPWDLELYLQMNARLRRRGQQAAAVFVYHLISRGTIEERVVRMLRAKDASQEMLLDAIEEELRWKWAA